MHETNGSNRQFIIIVSAILLVFISIQSQAFCIHNQTETRLFFMVEPSGTKDGPAISFQKWIEAEESECCKWNNKTCNPLATQDAKMSFYAFDAEDALEGCDRFGNASSEITLNAFIRFDRCHWGR